MLTYTLSRRSVYRLRSYWVSEVCFHQSVDRAILHSCSSVTKNTRVNKTLISIPLFLKLNFTYCVFAPGISYLYLRICLISCLYVIKVLKIGLEPHLLFQVWYLFVNPITHVTIGICPYKYPRRYFCTTTEAMNFILNSFSRRFFLRRSLLQIFCITRHEALRYMMTGFTSIRVI